MDELATMGTIGSSFRPRLFCQGICLLNRHQTGDTDSVQPVLLLPVQRDSQETFLPCEARMLWYSADRTSSQQLRDTTDFRDNPLNLSTREGFVLEDAARLTIGTLIIRQGSESDQPTAIFKDNDNVSGKLVDIQHLICDGPDGVGPIPLVTPGREANFTWLSNRFKHYVAGRYYFPQMFIGTGTAGAVSAGRLYAVPIEIPTPTTFTKIGINQEIPRSL